LLLDRLKLTDCSTELLALQCVANRAFECRLQCACDLRGAGERCVVKESLRFAAARRRLTDEIEEARATGALRS